MSPRTCLPWAARALDAGNSGKPASSGCSTRSRGSHVREQISHAAFQKGRARRPANRGYVSGQSVRLSRADAENQRAVLRTSDLLVLVVLRFDTVDLRPGVVRVPNDRERSTELRSC